MCTVALCAVTQNKLLIPRPVVQLQNSVTIRGRQTVKNSESLDLLNSADFHKIIILAGELRC